MPEEMTMLGELTSFLDRRPFHPFRIVMNNGDRYEITRNHQVAIGRSVIFIADVRVPSIYLRISSITSLEDSQPAS